MVLKDRGRLERTSAQYPDTQTFRIQTSRHPDAWRFRHLGNSSDSTFKKKKMNAATLTLAKPSNNCNVIILMYIRHAKPTHSLPVEERKEEESIRSHYCHSFKSVEGITNLLQ